MKWVLEVNNDWKQLLGKWNWYEFTFIHLYVEKSWHGYELWIALLGFHLYVRYNTDKSLDQFDEWEQVLEEDDLMSFEEFKKMWHED